MKTTPNNHQNPRIFASKRFMNGTWTALFVLAPLLLSSCDKLRLGGSAPGSSASAAASAGAPSSSASAATSANAGQNAAQPAAPSAPTVNDPKGIAVVIKDFQILHPYSSERAIQSIRDNESFSTRDSSANFGVGMIIEATNNTGELLQSVGFTGEIHFQNGERETVCTFSEDKLGEFSFSRVLSYTSNPGKADPFTGEKPTNWKVEDSDQEGVWRPSERIRMFTRRDWCETPVLEDMGVTKIHGRIVVKAYQRFIETASRDLSDQNYDMTLLGGDTVRVQGRKTGRVTLIPLKERIGDRTEFHVQEIYAKDGAPAGGEALPLKQVRLSRPWRLEVNDAVESKPVEFDIHPSALTLQMVKVSNGDIMHASGNILVFAKDGKVVYQDMAKQKLSLLEATHVDIPATPPDITFQQNELSGKVTSMALTHFTEDTELVKGQRKLSITWKLNLKGDDIDSRLRAGLDAAKETLSKAETAAEQANQGGDAGEVAKAKAAVAKAKSDVGAAETKYKTGVSSERGKIAKLLSCGEVKLATNKTIRLPTNAKAAAEACKALLSSNETDVIMSYTLDRYELPVALVYTLGKDFSFDPIGSESLIKLDPR